MSWRIWLGSLATVVLFSAPGALAQRAQGEEVAEGPAPGETVRLAEGWFRIEAPDTAREGFLGTISPSPESQRQQQREAPASPPQAEAAARSAPQRRQEEPRCRAERARYMEELFRIAGIWSFPKALTLVEALDVTPGLTASPWVRFNLFGVGTAGTWVGSPSGVDPIRPLAWDEGLRWAAEDLIRCVEADGSSPRFR